MTARNPTNAADLGEQIARAQRGDREALEAVLAAIAPSVHRFGLRMCKNVHDAEDVLQDTLAAAGMSLLTGAMGCSCVGYWGVVGLVVGFAAGTVPGVLRRLFARPAS